MFLLAPEHAEKFRTFSKFSKCNYSVCEWWGILQVGPIFAIAWWWWHYINDSNFPYISILSCPDNFLISGHLPKISDNGLCPGGTKNTVRMDNNKVVRQMWDWQSHTGPLENKSWDYEINLETGKQSMGLMDKTLGPSGSTKVTWIWMEGMEGQ